MWFIGVEVEQETSAPPLKKNPGSAPEANASMTSIFPHFDVLNRRAAYMTNFRREKVET